MHFVHSRDSTYRFSSLQLKEGCGQALSLRDLRTAPVLMMAAPEDRIFRTSGFAKHTVFLSYSRKDEEFVQWLAEQLKRHCFMPFFDEESLPAGGTATMDSILEIAETCKLGVIVVSNSFFSETKNPMLELATFVKKGVQLFPLFYKLTVKDVKNKTNRQAWEEKWKQWSQDDDRIDVCSWIDALKALTDTTGLEYDRCEASNRVRYACLAVEKICCILPSDLCPSDEHVQGKKRLCQEVKRMFAKAPSIGGAKVLALYGMEGVGKSELRFALRRFYNSDFAGRVCYIAFPKQSLESEREHYALERKDILTVLKDLTYISHDAAETIITTVEKGIAYLDTHLKQSSQKFLLILDNIHEHSLDEARKLILGRPSYPDGSHLLFLGRRRNCFETLLGPIDDGSHTAICKFPELEFGEVEKLFLNEVQSERVKMQWQVNYDADPKWKRTVERCVNLCRVSGPGGSSYNPLMVKSLASFFRAKHILNREKWEEKLELLEKDRREAMQSIFDLFQQSYHMLKEQERDLFLDLALYTLVAGRDHVLEKLHFEKMENFLQKRVDTSLCSEDLGVLDVHRDFARELAKDSEKLLFVQGPGRNSAHVKWMLRQKRDLEKVALVKFEYGATQARDAACLNLALWKHIRVLLLDNVKGLTYVDLGQNEVSRVEIESEHALRVQGIEACSLTLRTQPDPSMSLKDWISFRVEPDRLLILELSSINNTPWKLDAAHLAGCNSLEFLLLHSVELTDSDLDLSCWPLLKWLKLSSLLAVATLSGLQSLMKLECFELTACNQVSELQLPGSLRKCSLKRCERLVRIIDVLQCVILDFGSGTASESAGGEVACFISNLELRGSGTIESLCELSVKQVRKRGLVQELVKQLTKASRLKRLEVDCAESGVCACDANPPNLRLLPSRATVKRTCPRTCRSTRPTSQCLAGDLEWKLQIDETATRLNSDAGDLAATPMEGAQVPA